MVIRIIAFWSTAAQKYPILVAEANFVALALLRFIGWVNSSLGQSFAKFNIDLGFLTTTLLAQHNEGAVWRNSRQTKWESISSVFSRELRKRPLCQQSIAVANGLLISQTWKKRLNSQWEKKPFYKAVSTKKCCFTLHSGSSFLR